MERSRDEIYTNLVCSIEFRISPFKRVCLRYLDCVLVHLKQQRAELKCIPQTAKQASIEAFVECILTDTNLTLTQFVRHHNNSNSNISNNNNNNNWESKQLFVDSSWTV